ncbi:MAG: PH domain-containing protein [Actinomycetota bacterium]|nr:PH domain-containing protein [Actinomycetota bacterium]
MAELGNTEVVVEAANGKIGNGLGYIVMTENRVILVGQAVRALASESTVESFDLGSISAVVLDEGMFQSTLTLTTSSGDVTVDNMTSGAARMAAALRTATAAETTDIPVDADPEATKRCPYCAEVIKAAAVKCRFCGEFL